MNHEINPESQLYGGPRTQWSDPAPPEARSSWGPYFDRIFPRSWTNSYGNYKRQTTGVNHARLLWSERERLRQWARQSDYHRGVVLIVPEVAYPACLDCAWLGISTSATDPRKVRRASRSAKRHGR